MSFVLPPGCTQADEIRKVAEQLGWTVSPFPEKFAATSFPRGKTIFCYADSLLDDIAEQYELEWDAKDGVLRFSAPRSVQAPRLSGREMKIWEVIQRGSQGLQYCRELDKAGVSPLRRGVWRNCSRSYASLYREGEPWRHRIQDEKSKIRRKAEVAGLASE